MVERSRQHSAAPWSHQRRPVRRGHMLLVLRHWIWDHVWHRVGLVRHQRIWRLVLLRLERVRTMPGRASRRPTCLGFDVQHWGRGGASLERWLVHAQYGRHPQRHTDRYASQSISKVLARGHTLITSVCAECDCRPVPVRRRLGEAAYLQWVAYLHLCLQEALTHRVAAADNKVLSRWAISR